MPLENDRIPLEKARHEARRERHILIRNSGLPVFKLIDEGTLNMRKMKIIP